MLEVFFSYLNGGRCVWIVNGVFMMEQESKNVSVAIHETSNEMTGDRVTKQMGGILRGKDNSKDAQLIHNIHY